MHRAGTWLESCSGWGNVAVGATVAQPTAEEVVHRRDPSSGRAGTL